MPSSRNNLAAESADRATTKEACTHARVVDDVRNAEGEKTGNLICRECRSIFPDPALKPSDRR